MMKSCSKLSNLIGEQCLANLEFSSSSDSTQQLITMSQWIWWNATKPFRCGAQASLQINGISSSPEPLHRPVLCERSTTRRNAKQSTRPTAAPTGDVGNVNCCRQRTSGTCEQHHDASSTSSRARGTPADVSRLLQAYRSKALQETVRNAEFMFQKRVMKSVLPFLKASAKLPALADNLRTCMQATRSRNATGRGERDGARPWREGWTRTSWIWCWYGWSCATGK